MQGGFRSTTINDKNMKKEKKMGIPNIKFKEKTMNKDGAFINH
jgi:hypothetical protein